MSQEGFALSEVGNEGCELTRRAIYFMLQRGSTIGSVLGGLVAASDLETTYAGSGLKIEVAPGECIVPGFNATQSGYYFRNTSTDTITPTAANASNPRIDRLVAKVEDRSYEGPGNNFVLDLLAGTPTSGATLTNLSGVATGAQLNSSMTLAYVLIPALATTITNADIKNVGTVLALGEHLIGDSQIVTGRALVETENKYSAPAARTLGVEYEPNATKTTFVFVSYSCHNGSRVFVGGVEMEGGGCATAGVTVECSYGFICPPGQKWMVTASEGSNLKSSYLTM